MAHSDQSGIERDRLARLGLPKGASEDQIETAHGDIVAFLETAPPDLRTWARSQISAADEAYALLFDPGAAAQAQPPVPAETTGTATTARPKRVMRTIAPEQPTAPAFSLSRVPRGLIAAAALVVVLAAGYVVYASDLPTVPGLTGTPAPRSSQAAIDTARVGQLMQAITANPNDVASLQELANIYFKVGDYGVAASWEEKVLAIEPDNVRAHLALGAAQFNLGNSADAEAHWRKVIELNPADPNLRAEAHYDLGFMYFSATPPDVERTMAEWQAVIDIAPNSDIAQVVMTHLQQIQGPSTSASPGSSASPVASGSPAASASAQPSASPVATARPSATAAQ